MLLSGNERMLTTLTTTTSAGAAAASIMGPSTGSTVAATRNGCKSNELQLNGKTGLSLSNGNGNGSNAYTMTKTEPTATIETTAPGSNAANVNGSCQSDGSHNSKTNNTNNNNNSNSNSKNQQQSWHADQGPGPPPPQAITSNIIPAVNGSGSGGGGCRVALGEYSVNNGAVCVSSNGALCISNNSHAFPMQQQQQQQHHLHLLRHSPCIASTPALSHHQSPQRLAADMPDNANVTLAPPPSLPFNITGIKLAAGQPVQCGYCCQPICDRYIMHVHGTSFHERCLKCNACSLHLVHSCFSRDDKLYCRLDYERIFMRNRCLGCGYKISSDELVMRTLENVFHLKCFACVVCGSLLKKGEQYVVKQGQLFCRFDYEKEVEMLQGYDFYGDDVFPPKLDGRRGPKRPRTILNTQQRRAFKASFEVSPKPCRKVRENLAKETGLSLRIVQVWFQNQRAKVKKIQKKAKLEHAKGSDTQDSQESDASMAKIKDEAQSDSETLLDSPYSCSTGSGSGTGGGGGGAITDTLVKMRFLRDDAEGISFNCIETNKENCNKTNEPFLNTILGLSYATFQQLMGPFAQSQSSMINPIDRLYSMQNSYFRPDELGSGGTLGDCIKDTPEN